MHLYEIEVMITSVLPSVKNVFVGFALTRMGDEHPFGVDFNADHENATPTPAEVIELMPTTIFAACPAGNVVAVRREGETEVWFYFKPINSDRDETKAYCFVDSEGCAVEL